MARDMYTIHSVTLLLLKELKAMFFTFLFFYLKLQQSSYAISMLCMDCFGRQWTVNVDGQSSLTPSMIIIYVSLCVSLGGSPGLSVCLSLSL